MAEQPIRQLRIDDTDKKPKISDTIGEHLDNTVTEELVIGLCGPIGTDIKFVSKKLKEIIEDTFDYQCIEIKMSKFIKINQDIDDDVRSVDYYNQVIEKGNKLRENHGNDILAKYAIHEIAKNRLKKSDGIEHSEDLVYSKRVCYIVNSIKHDDEFRLLKKVYQNIFYFIGVFSPLEIRKNNMLGMQISKPDIETLIEIDSEQPEKHGQKVSKTFMNADYFMRIEDSHEQIIRDKLTRFLDLIFGTKIITPSVNENAMYLASSASANSACMSRQVGASITNENGEVISVGWNDVPKFGGNLYTEGDKNDHRCMNKNGGTCFNDQEKKLLVNLIGNELLDKKAIHVNQLENITKILEKSRIKDLLEFSRAVHAEMHAIINATQKSGSEIIGGNLYCTTYPCHNCARHIVASGIKEVYYIEPYSKSLALKLHDDSITENSNEDKKTKILMYDGVAPSRFMDLFKMTDGLKRKKDGIIVAQKRKTAHPRNSLSLDAIPFLEQKATRELDSLGILN